MSKLAIVKLGDVADFIRGVTYKPTDVTTAEDQEAIACLRTKNIQIDLEDDDLVYIPRAAIRKDKIIQSGDIIVSSANSWNLVGKCSWVPELHYEATFGGFTSVLRGREAQILPRYLYHWFSTSYVQALARSFGQQTTNISNLNHKRCLDLDVPLPPLDEQRRIAAILDKADALRRKRKRALELLDGLTAEIFRTSFSGQRWPLLELAGVVKSRTIVTYGIVQAGEEYDGGVPYIRTGDISDGEIKVDGLRRTDPAIAAKFNRSRVEAAEIVMSIRATVGTTAVVPPELDGANLTQGTARIAPGEKVRLHYLLSYLRSAECQAWIKAQVKGATFREITLKRLRELEVPVPPMELQEQFQKRAIKVAHQIQLAKLQLSTLDGNFASLQHRAFSGQL